MISGSCSVRFVHYGRWHPRCPMLSLSAPPARLNLADHAAHLQFGWPYGQRRSECLCVQTETCIRRPRFGLRANWPFLHGRRIPDASANARSDAPHDELFLHALTACAGPLRFGVPFNTLRAISYLRRDGGVVKLLGAPFVAVRIGRHIPRAPTALTLLLVAQALYGCQRRLRDCGAGQRGFRQNQLMTESFCVCVSAPCAWIVNRRNLVAVQSRRWRGGGRWFDCAAMMNRCNCALRPHLGTMIWLAGADLAASS